MFYNINMTLIVNFNSDEDIDNAIIPNDIYNETINKETVKIEDYFILHPHLLLSFVGYNSALKLANELSSNKKCGCFYKLPWITHYQHVNNTEKLSLSFSQQVEEYRYMIRYWIPSPVKSHMQYLSEIALSMIQNIKQYTYYRTNNREDCTIFQKKYYKNNFPNPKVFNMHIFKYFQKY